jgi:hypothetical protein
VSSAKTWYVDDKVGPMVNFSKIQEAVDVASDGDTIYVYTGTYDENLVINKALKLIGEDKNNTIIYRWGGTIVNITSDNVTFSGFTIKNGTIGISFCSNNSIITNNTILNIKGGKGHCRSNGSDGIGIKFVSSTNVSISNNTISNIRGGQGGDCSGYCPEVLGKGKGGDGYGFILSSSYNITISGNTISSIEGGKGGLGGFSPGYNRPGSGGDGYGIFISSSTNITLLHNKISSVGGKGGTCGDINCWGSSRGGDGYGIYVSSNNNKIFNNLISDVKGGLGFHNNANDPPYICPHCCGKGYKGYDNSIGGNAWDKGTRIGGNYWNSSCEGNPSNGSQPYNISGSAGSQDHFPFEDPDGWITSSVRINKQYAILDSSYTADMYVWGDYHNTYVMPAMEMMEELPEEYAYNLVNDSQIENGDLVSLEYKALILPNAISLSDLECSQICNFVDQGGLIFATAQTSRYKPGVGWRSDFGLDCLGVTYKSDKVGYVWNMDIVENCSILLKGVFEKSESNDDISICGGDLLVLVDLKPVSDILTIWKDPHVSEPAFIESHYGSGNVVYSTGKLFEGWKQCKEEHTWGSKDSEPCQNAEKLLWNTLYSHASPISNMNLSHWWLISQMREQMNLIDSYEDGDKAMNATDCAYIYDQALAVFAFTCLDDYDNAGRILEGLSMTQNVDGSFPFCVSAKTEEVYSFAKYTGTNAWVVMAINYYTDVTGNTTYVNMARDCANWFLQFKDTDGGIKGGIDGSGYNISWKSTEHNLDAYVALSNLCYITGNSTYCSAAKDVREWIRIEAWNDSEGRFWRGKNDSYCAMDVNPWGTLALGIKGSEGEDYRLALDWADNNCQNTQNWNSSCEYIYDIEGFDFNWDCDTVWIEGTESMSCALFHANYTVNDKNSNYIHKEIEKLHGITGNGGLPYSTNPGTIDESSEISATYSSVAGTAWYIFAEKQLNPFNIIKGDLNHDGKITSADVRIALAITFSSEYVLEADMDSNGHVNVLDVRMIMQAAVKS